MNTLHSLELFELPCCICIILFMNVMLGCKNVQNVSDELYTICYVLMLCHVEK